jgi:hypothetical protein
LKISKNKIEYTISKVVFDGLYVGIVIDKNVFTACIVLLVFLDWKIKIIPNIKPAMPINPIMHDSI